MVGLVTMSTWCPSAHPTTRRSLLSALRSLLSALRSHEHVQDTPDRSNSVGCIHPRHLARSVMAFFFYACNSGYGFDGAGVPRDWQVAA